ncbi:MAG: DUF2785 domain-containing protein [Anaerolineae bacterium]|nr:DUF2785 domain-containing protein [Anaerolineae bacterium]
MQLTAELLQSIEDNQFHLPDAVEPTAFTEALIEGLASIDPDIRERCYTVFGYRLWGKGNHPYTAAQRLEYGQRLCSQVQATCGSVPGDSVFFRAFAALILAEIVGADLEQQQLPPHIIRQWMQTVLACFTAEQDLRGYVAEKGWAHALAHMADFLYVCTLHPAITRDDLLQILNTIQQKLAVPRQHALVYQEDERLCRPVLGAVKSGKLSMEDLSPWLAGFVPAANGAAWSETMQQPALAYTRHTLVCFLRSLYLQMQWRKKEGGAVDPESWQAFQQALADTLQEIDRNLYERPL